jgi:putative copper resistance protein D
MALAAADLLQQGATALGNGALAVLFGSVAMPGALGRPLPSRRVALGAVLALAVAQAGLLWWQAAAMGDVPLPDAGPQVWPVLTATHAGAAWAVGAVGLIAMFAALLASPASPAAPVPRSDVDADADADAGAGAGVAGRLRPGARGLALAAGLLAVCIGRAAAGHAGSTGGPLAFAMDFVHVVAGSLWAGLVIVGAAVVLKADAPATPEDRRAMRGYVLSLSTWATVALAAIVATGTFAMWRTLVLVPVPVGGIVGTAYGQWLAAKLAGVALAVTLGAHNRFQGLPAVVRALDDAQAPPRAALRAFRQVLVVESVVLALVLAAAALLATSAPPGATA